MNNQIKEEGLTDAYLLGKYDGIKQGRAEAEEDAENRMSRILDDEKRLSYEQGRKDTIDDIASTILTEMEFGVGGSIENFLVEYFEQLKEQADG